MKRLYTPRDESELVFLKSLFEASRMPYYVQNENFGSLYTGSYMSSLNAKTIMVPEDIFEDERRGEGEGGLGSGGLLDGVLELLSLKKKGRDKG